MSFNDFWSEKNDAVPFGEVYGWQEIFGVVSRKYPRLMEITSLILMPWKPSGQRRSESLAWHRMIVPISSFPLEYRKWPVLENRSSSLQGVNTCFSYRLNILRCLLWLLSVGGWNWPSWRIGAWLSGMAQPLIGCVACGLLGHLSTPLSPCLSFLVSKVTGARKTRWFSSALPTLRFYGSPESGRYLRGSLRAFLHG